MKIAMIVQPWDEVHPAGRGGGASIGIIASELASRLAAEHTMLLYAKRFAELPLTDEPDGLVRRRIPVKFESYLHRGIEVIEPEFDRGWFRLPYVASTYYFRRYGQRIAVDVASSGCEIAHVHNFSQYLPLIRARNPHIKLVLHMHCNWLVELDQATIEERLQCADLIIGPSEHVSERIRARFPQVAGRCRTLFNGVDLGLFSPRTNQARPDVAPRIVYVGRISPEKGVHVLMDAFERVLRTLPDAHLDLYGAISQLPYNFCAGLSDEPQVRALKRYYRGGPLNKLGMARARARYMIEMQQRHPAVVGRKAIFHGSEPHPALADAYRNAAVVVFPSVCYEGFGMAIAEAMASEVPVVAARAGGITDLVERVGAGVLVDRDDADGMAAAILHLLNDPDRRRDMAARGRQFAIRELAWDQLTRQLEGHYEDLLAPAPR